MASLHDTACYATLAGDKKLTWSANTHIAYGTRGLRRPGSCNNSSLLFSDDIGGQVVRYQPVLPWYPPSILGHTNTTHDVNVYKHTYPHLHTHMMDVHVHHSGICMWDSCVNYTVILNLIFNGQSVLP